MNCSYHQDVAAIGVCSKCGRGLCEECKVELGGDYFCQSCADKVYQQINDSTNDVSAGYYILPILLAFVGGLIAYFANDNYKKNKTRAKNMLGVGIFISVVYIITFYILSFS